MLHLIHPDTVTEEIMFRADLFSNSIPYVLRNLFITAIAVITVTAICYFVFPLFLQATYTLAILYFVVGCGMIVIYKVLTTFLNLIDEVYYLLGYRLYRAMKILRISAIGIVMVKAINVTLLVLQEYIWREVVYYGFDLHLFMQYLETNMIWRIMYSITALSWSIFLVSYAYVMFDIGKRIGLISFKIFAWMKIITAVLSISFWNILAPEIFEVWVFFEILSYFMLYITLGSVKDKIYEKIMGLLKEPERVKDRLLEELIF